MCTYLVIPRSLGGYLKFCCRSAHKATGKFRIILIKQSRINTATPAATRWPARRSSCGSSSVPPSSRNTPYRINVDRHYWIGRSRRAVRHVFVCPVVSSSIAGCDCVYPVISPCQEAEATLAHYVGAVSLARQLT